MAGIAGVLGKDAGELKQILDKINYRGPDETWFNKQDPVNLGCLELNVGGSCQDGAHHVYDGKVAAIIDGRVYNPEKGTMTDAEAVIALYKKYGILFPEYLDGDFACAVSDGGQLILARDWAGIKPLYYGQQWQTMLCFGSQGTGRYCRRC